MSNCLPKSGVVQRKLGAIGRYERGSWHRYGRNKKLRSGLLALLLGARTLLGTKGIATRSKNATRVSTVGVNLLRNERAPWCFPPLASRLEATASPVGWRPLTPAFLTLYVGDDDHWGPCVGWTHRHPAACMSGLLRISVVPVPMRMT